MSASIVRDVQDLDVIDYREEEKARRLRLDNDLADSRIKSLEADRRMRETYAGRILRYLEAYSAVVGLMVIIAGFRFGGFALPMEILASLVGSTAVAAIGLVGFIARGLFQLPKAT